MDWDLEVLPFIESLKSGQTAIDIYAQDLFEGKTPAEILNELEGLETRVYKCGNKVVGVASVDEPLGPMDDYVLEWMAVDNKQQSKGYGAAIIRTLISNIREEGGEGRLYVTTQSSTANYYVDVLGAIEDDGGVYFDLED